MADESGLDGDINREETSSTGHSTVMEAEKTAENSCSQQDSDKSREMKEVTGAVPFYKLFSFADSTDHILMLVGTVGALGNGICMPLVSVLLGEAINSFGQNVNTQNVVPAVSKVSLKYQYLALGSSVAAFFQVVCWMVTGERQAARIRSLYLKNILRQDIAYFDTQTNTGEIMDRMSNDTVLIQDAIGEKTGKFISLAAAFLGGFAIAFIKGWLLTLVLASSIPPLAISATIMMTFIVKLTSRGQKAYSLAAAVVEQTVGSIRTVASFTGERQAIARYEQSLIKAYRSGVLEGLAAGLGTGVFMCFVFSSYALAVWFGSKMILHNGYTGGDVLNVMIAVLTGSFSLGQATPCMTVFATARGAAFKMFETISRESDIDPYNMDEQKLDDIRGDIDLKDVCFSYPSRPDEKIFNGFSLSIPSGTTAALVGQSGSGKSTVINLIERFYDPQGGEVLIDGINLKEFQLRWIRGKIGLVNQEPVLFTATIRDNIAYGKDDATTEEIKDAAELANAAKFIDKLPQGLDTMVGEQGTQLSGGQKQRLAIARAILKDPRILLLDEATSALDAESERVVQEALDRVMINRTTIIVAHRLSTVKNADTIAVIHQGKIAEKGSHSELMQDAEGAYCQLLRLQEQKKESEDHVVNDQELPEITTDSESSSRHQSISASIGAPTAKDILDPPTAEPKVPALAPSTKTSEVSLARLAKLNKPEIPVLLLGSIAAVANGIVLPVFGVFLSMIVKTFYEPAHELRKDSRFWASMFVLLGLLNFFSIPLRTYFFSVAGCQLIRRIRLMCFEKVVFMEIGWFDEVEHSSGTLGARLSSDASSVRGLVGDPISLVVQNTATALAGLIIAFAANWQLALIVLATVPIIIVHGYFQMKFINGFTVDAKRKYEDASQVVGDGVGSIRTVASFCAEEKVMQLYQKKCEGLMKAGIDQGLISGAGFGLALFCLYSAYATSFYAGARLVHDGKTTFDKFFQVFFGLSMAGVGISQSSSLIPDASKAKSATTSVFAILDQKSKIDSSDDSGTTLDNVEGEIQFNHVSFKYHTRPDIQIFRDLCLTIRPGKTVALVGESGSGKSTVISLLQRFYDPTSGQITLDGVEIQKLKLKWLRQQMGLVSQEPILFNDTVRANIAFGKEGNATEAEIFAAAELANAHKFISGLQQGYDTTVGEKGIQLSGGQKQRVAIARAVVKDPKILLLDEATSALDAESEKVVQDALDRIMVDRTTVVVAHRLSTVKGADLIAVVKNGVIVEKGTHETLINIKDGVYASLVSLQTRASS